MKSTDKPLPKVTYMCTNCCCLRFESNNGVCPNCGGQAKSMAELELEFKVTFK